MSKQQKVWYNNKQLAFLQAKQSTKVFLAGRGAGKSVCISGKTVMRLKKLPRGRGIFASTTYKQILDSTLPAIEGKLEEMKFKEGIHYVVGRTPPKHFERPYQRVRNYENCLSFFNGYTVTFLSMDRMDLRRGGSFDAADIDEAALVKQEAINKVIVPSMRGNRNRFSHWLHHQICLYTSMPWKPSGYYILEYQELAEAYPEEFYFLEADVYDNIQILGEAGIERYKRMMTHLEFQVECLNMRIKKIEGGYYYKFNEEIHCYTPEYVYGEGERGITWEGNKDYNPNELIDSSWDFSGWFNCCILYQSKPTQHRVVEKAIDSAFVKGDEKIDELVDKICTDYQDHKFKYIRIWGEPRGHDKNPHGQTIYEKIQRRFEKNGWMVEIKVTPHQVKMHFERFKLMNDILSEEDPNLPVMRFNQDTCKAVIIAHQTCEVTDDYKKDKSKERDRKFPQEHAPHFTDCNDYYLDQKHGWRVLASAESSGGEFDFA